MAKRLNKKVAIIGMAILIVVAFTAIGIVLSLNANPEKHIADGDMAFEAARSTTDAAKRDEILKKAAYSYNKARSKAKDDALQVVILNKLVDVYTETQDWEFIRGCWNKIIQLDPKDYKTRVSQLNYFYILADSGARSAWKEIISETTDFLEKSDSSLLSQKVSEFGAFSIKENEIADTLGGYLYLLKGRGEFEIAKFGAATDVEQLYEQAIENLNKSLEYETTNVMAYYYLAQVLAGKADIFEARNDITARDDFRSQSKKMLEKAIETDPSNVKAHINFLSMRPILEGMKTKEAIKALESDYKALLNKFPDSAEAHALAVNYYRMQGVDRLDTSMEQIDKAMALEPQNVTYALMGSGNYFARYSIKGDKSDFDKAASIAENALLLPDSLDAKGPRQWANKINRMRLTVFLTDIYLDRVLESRWSGTDIGQEKEQLLSKAEKLLHDIEQLYGNEDNQQAIKWNNIYELAKGNKDSAIATLYDIYLKLKASEQVDSKLAYILAEEYKNSSELGAAAEFFETALVSGKSMSERIADTKPTSLLDYADVFIKLQSYQPGLSAVDYYENAYGTNQKSQGIRARCYIGASQFEEAETVLSKLQDDERVIQLKMDLLLARIRKGQLSINQLKFAQGTATAVVSAEDKSKDDASIKAIEAEVGGYKLKLAGLLDKQLQLAPESVSTVTVMMVANKYVEDGQREKAQSLVDTCIEKMPDKTILLSYKEIFSRPDTQEIKPEELNAIEEKTLLGIKDPVKKSGELGIFYQRINEPDKAKQELKKVVEPYLSKDAKELSDPVKAALSSLFDVSIATKDFDLAGKILDTIKAANLDGCGGNFYGANLSVAQKDYQQALAQINDGLKLRPIFSHGYMLRSNIYLALDNEGEAINDARKAVSLNPLDGNIAKAYANVLYQRSEKLGTNATAEIIKETKDSLMRAIALNPNEWTLQSLYAEFISEREPERALAIRQSLYRAVPNVGNAFLLGRMSAKLGIKETDAAKKKAFFEMAEDSFSKALLMDPNNNAVVQGFAQYYKQTGQDDKAEKLLSGFGNKSLIWKYDIQNGKFDEARKILEDLNKKSPENMEVLKGLLIVAQSTGDKEGVKRYSGEIVSGDPNAANYIMQIEHFLDASLLTEAEASIEKFTQKFADNANILRLNAWLRFRQGRLSEALDMITKDLEKNQDNVLSWRLRGQINLMMANNDDAVLDLKKSRAISGTPQITFALAKAYISSGREEEAINELKSIINDGQLGFEVRGLLEGLYLKLNRKSVLNDFYNESIKKFGDSAHWYNRVARFAASEKDFARAEQMYKTGRDKLTPDDKEAAEIVDGYLGVLIAQGKTSEVLEEGNKYADSSYAPMAFIRMCEAKVVLGDKAGAAEYAQKAIEKSGTNDAYVLVILQRIYVLLGDKEVLRIANDMLSTNPNSVAANYAMFNLMYIKGEYNKALEYIEKCVAGSKAGSNESIGYILRKIDALQALYARTSDKQYLTKVIEGYESVLDKTPNNTSVMNNLAYTLASADLRLEDALKYIEQVIKLNVDNPEFLDTYGYVLYKNGNYQKAAEMLRSCVQQMDMGNRKISWELYRHLGMANEKIGEKQQALEAYNKAMEILNAITDTQADKAKAEVTEAVKRLSM